MTDGLMRTDPFDVYMFRARCLVGAKEWVKERSGSAEGAMMSQSLEHKLYGAGHWFEVVQLTNTFRIPVNFSIA